MILLLASFVGGLLTVLAPCILPFLPIVLGKSLDEKINYSKTLTIIFSLSLSIFIFTFLLKYSTILINIPENFWKYFSGTIIFSFGISYLFPNLFKFSIVEKIQNKINLKSNKLLQSGNSKNSFTGNILIGLSLGPIFSTCSPTYFIILASVLPVSLWLGTIYLFVYILGVAISLFAIVFATQKLFAKYIMNINFDGKFGKSLGILFIIIGLLIMSGYDKKIESYFVDKTFDFTKIEQRILEKSQKVEAVKEEAKLQENLSVPILPEVINIKPSIETLKKAEIKNKIINIQKINGFINTDGKEIKLENEIGKGKVVLVSIWTYGCINCQRTLPYLNDWYKKYKDNGFEIISIHTPEFSFEKKQENIENFAKKNNIKYPIIMDNDYKIWNSFENQYWPRKYLFDKEGRLIMDVIGEGKYIEMEENIKNALLK
jgi:cytochrome c biogenesis protein CcdA/peroxiredoxin